MHKPVAAARKEPDVKKNLTLAVWLGVFFLSASAPSFGQDMYLELEDGLEIVLYQDYSWDYSQGNGPRRTEISYIELEDGRELAISPDHTWGYRQAGKEGSLGKLEQLESLYAIGVARRADYQQATTAARTEADRRLALQILPLAQDASLQYEDVLSCLQKSPGDVQYHDEKKDGWQVTARITMDGENLSAVLQCLGKN